MSDLKNLGALVEIKAHWLMVPRCARTQQIIEPMLTDQWFMSMHGVAIGDPTGQSIAQKAISAVQSGEVQFVPSNWINTYNEWMGSIEDWCISRQLWWGHQIPAWYDANGHVYVASNEQDAQRLAGEGAQLRQDPDVLDTWYSSALAPFASMAPDIRVGDWLRYHLFLGSPYDHDDQAFHGERSIQGCVHPWIGARF